MTESDENPQPTTCDGFQSWQKIKTLPRVINEYQQCKMWYERIKKQHWKLGMCCSGIEILVFHLVNLLMTFYSADVVSPFACWMITKGITLLCIIFSRCVGTRYRVILNFNVFFQYHINKHCLF